MAELIYSIQQFIFDSITQLIILICCFLLYFKTRELYSLSLQKGIKFFKNAMLFYVFSFSFRYITTFFDFIIDGNYNTFQFSLIGIVLTYLNIFTATMGGFYLAYSLVWRKFEKVRTRTRNIMKKTILYSTAIIIVSIDMYLMVFKGIRTPFLFFGIVITVLLYAIFSNIIWCRKTGRDTKDISPFLSLVGLGLGVYIVLLIENLVDPYLFTIHYYSWAIATVFTLTFLYYLNKTTG